MNVIALRDPNPYVLGVAVEERVANLEPRVIGVVPRRRQVDVQFVFDGVQHVAWLTYD